MHKPVPLAPPARLAALYDTAAARWQEGIARLGYPAAYAEMLDRAPPPRDPARVLDVGTGSGAFAAAFAARAGRIGRLDLLDFSAPMLTEAAARLSGAAREVRTLRAPLGTPDTAQDYDTVLCAHVIEHLPDPQAALAWLHDRLRPGGRLWLAVSRPHWCTALIRLRWGNRAFRPATVAAMLDRAGFADVAVLPFAKGPPARTSCGYAATRPG